MQTPIQRRHLLWLLLFCCSTLGLGCDPTEPTIAADIRGETNFKVGQAVNITFTLSNSSHAVLYMLDWGTPFEGFKSAFFVVERDGEKLEYKGPVAKRGEPRKDEYSKLTFGEIALVTLDLTQAYDLKKPGKYTVKLATNIVDYTFDEAEVPRKRAQHKSYTLTAAPHIFEITQ